MKQLVGEFDRRAATAPDDVVAIDAEGAHRLATVLDRAAELAAVLEARTGPRPP